MSAGAKPAAMRHAWWGALLVLLLLLSDVAVWVQRGLLPGPEAVQTVAGVYRRADRKPVSAELEAERLFGPPPPR